MIALQKARCSEIYRNIKKTYKDLKNIYREVIHIYI